MHAGVPVWLALLRAGLKGHRSICLNIWANRVKYTILACLSDRRDRCTMQPFWIHHAWRCTGGQIEFTDAREHAVSLSQQQQRTALNTHTHTHTHTPRYTRTAAAIIQRSQPVVCAESARMV
mmetsp:Transcript_52002/g.101833  ORF Transcript_52002/g.101833 Transcript_52002/m.101833 type:complete len:122 (-) Transcript_52002:1523-1888(-)